MRWRIIWSAVSIYNGLFSFGIQSSSGNASTDMMLLWCSVIQLQAKLPEKFENYCRDAIFTFTPTVKCLSCQSINRQTLPQHDMHQPIRDNSPIKIIILITIASGQRAPPCDTIERHTLNYFNTKSYAGDKHSKPPGKWNNYILDIERACLSVYSKYC